MSMSIPVFTIFLFLILVLGAVLAIVALFAKTMSGRSNQTHPSELSADTRSALHSFKELHRALEKIVQDNRDVAEIKVIGELALQESEKIQARATKLLEMRSELKRTLYGQKEARMGLDELNERLAGATSQPERDSLESAITARKQEIAHYDSVEATVNEVDGKIREAEASLAELKARLATGAVGARASAIDAEDMSGMVERLKGLSRSFSEAEDMIEDKIR